MIPWYVKHAVHGDQPWAVQREALNRSEGKAKYGYFLQQGLGKTPLILNDFLHYADASLMLVVAPQSFKLDWLVEADAWGISKELMGKDWTTGFWPRDPIPFDADKPGIYSINYEAVSRSSAKDQLVRLMDERPVFLTIDESAAIKNNGTGFSKSVVQLAHRAMMVREANGTPLVQNVMDYYPQLRALGEFHGWTSHQFKSRYAKLGGFMGKVVQREEIKNKEELYAVLDRCSFRALKKDWRADMPDQIDIPLHLEMTERQLRHYREMMLDFYTMVNDMEVTAQLILTQMMRLQQISSCLASTDASKWVMFEEAKDNPKLQATYDIMDSAPGKTIVVHVFKPSGALLRNEMEAKGLRPAVIRGGLTPEQIIEEKRRFNEDPDCRVLIAQQSAAFRGHTLLGDVNSEKNSCHRMVFYESSFSYYEYSQIRDRIHRGDASFDCRYYQLRTSPADDHIYDTLASKQDMADTMDKAVAAIRSGKWRV